MEKNHVVLYVHYIWATRNRTPSISEEQEAELSLAVEYESDRIGVKPMAIGFMPDHMHVLILLPATMPVEQYVRNIKQTVSRYINRNLTGSQIFRWEDSYKAMTVSPWDAADIMDYIRNQKEYHHEGTIRLQHELPDE